VPHFVPTDRAPSLLMSVGGFR